MSKEIKDNWFVVLELDFYPKAEENEEIIRNRIEEKKSEWERRKVRAYNKENFIRYINSYETIKKEMLGSNNIRKELIEDALAPVDNALKMGEGSIKVFTDDIIKKISRETKRSEKVVRQRIMENPNFELYDETIYNDYLDIIKKKADFEVIEKLLKTLNSEDIYSFLDSQNLKFETLNNSVINKERKKLENLHNNISSAKYKLYSQIEDMVNNNEEKQKYDKYLKYSKVMKELNYVKIYKNGTVGIKPVQNIKKILGNEKEATNIFIGFCEENNIAYNLSDNSDTAIADTLNDENENFKIASDNKQTNYMIRYAVALAVFALGVFIINTYFIGI